MEDNEEGVVVNNIFWYNSVDRENPYSVSMNPAGKQFWTFID
jgi:hypothetical protein